MVLLGRIISKASEGGYGDLSSTINVYFNRTKDVFAYSLSEHVGIFTDFFHCVKLFSKKKAESFKFKCRYSAFSET